MFHGHGAGFFARWFGAPSFRHCFVCLTSGGYWTRLDFKIGVPEFEVISADSFDLEGFYRNAGFAVAPVARAAGRAASAKTIWPLMMANCVGSVKSPGAAYALSTDPETALPLLEGTKP